MRHASLDTFSGCPCLFMPTSDHHGTAEPEGLCAQVCGVSLKSGTYPVPVIPVAEIADLAPVLEASYAVHDRLQHTFHTTFVMG